MKTDLSGVDAGCLQKRANLRLRIAVANGQVNILTVRQMFNDLNVPLANPLDAVGGR
jgi:hypothetical protein